MTNYKIFKALKLLMVAGVLTASLSVQAATARFERTIDASEAPTIEISTNGGDVVVEGADTDKVEVRAIVTVDKRLSKRNPVKAGNLLRAIQSNPPIEVDGERIVIGELKRSAQKRYLEISYVITVPNQSSVTAQSESGDIRVSGVQGEVSATSETGEVS